MKATRGELLRLDIFFSEACGGLKYTYSSLSLLIRSPWSVPPFFDVSFCTMVP